MNSIAGRLHNVKYSISESKTKKQQRLRLRRPRTASLFSIAEIEIDGSVVPLFGRSIKSSIPAWVKRAISVDDLEDFLCQSFVKHSGTYDGNLYVECSDYLSRQRLDIIEKFCENVGGHWQIDGTAYGYPTRNVAVLIEPGRKKLLGYTDLAALEPRLSELLEFTKQIVADANTAEKFCANDIWVKVLKPRISGLVGWRCDSQETRLGTNEAFDVVSDRLLSMLPPCKGDCNCL